MSHLFNTRCEPFLLLLMKRRERRSPVGCAENRPVAVDDRYKIWKRAEMKSCLFHRFFVREGSDGKATIFIRFIRKEGEARQCDCREYCWSEILNRNEEISSMEKEEANTSTSGCAHSSQPPSHSQTHIHIEDERLCSRVNARLYSMYIH